MRRHSLSAFAVHPLAAFLFARDRERTRDEWRSQKRAGRESCAGTRVGEGKRFSGKSDTADEGRSEMKESRWMSFPLNRV
jgi:hypothetical protein